MIHGHEGIVSKVVVPEARPWPLIRRLYKPALHRTRMPRPQLLKSLPFTPHVQVIESSLPDAVGGVRVQGGRQAEPRLNELRFENTGRAFARGSS